MAAMNKFKHQTEMALKELETGKLLVKEITVVYGSQVRAINFPIIFQTMLKYDENQMSTSYTEFCKIYELIQQYFSLDHSEQVECTFNAQSDKKK